MMGWISDRHMRQGGSIGTGPAKGIGNRPLRRVTAILRPAASMFDYDWVALECGHEGKSYGGARARCRECAAPAKETPA